MNNYTLFSGDNPFATQAKMLLHLDKLHQYQTNGDTDCPIFMEIGLTDKCNMACYWCITELGRDNKAGAEILDTKASSLGKRLHAREWC